MLYIVQAEISEPCRLPDVVHKENSASLLGSNK